MTPSFTSHLGIDPGWKNLGMAIVNKDLVTGELTKVISKVYNPSELGGVVPFIQALSADLSKLDWEPTTITVERFVAYAGVDSAETERICMLIGALSLFSEYNYGINALLLRAIDWKVQLAQSLHLKKGFENPSTKLDKKFSLAAASACLSVPFKFKTDHEADALCLASFPVIIAPEVDVKKKRSNAKIT